MRTRAYAAARPGILSALESLGGGGGYDDAYNDTLKALASVDYQGSGAMLNREKTRGQQIMNRARERIPQEFAAVPDLGRHSPALAALYQAAENIDPADYTTNLKDLQNIGLKRQATDMATGGAGNDALNRVLSVLSEKAYTPYAVQGDMLIDAGTGAAGMTPLGAAKTRAEDALARERGFKSVENTLFDISGPPQVAGVAVPKPGDSARKFEGFTVRMPDGKFQTFDAQDRAGIAAALAQGAVQATPAAATKQPPQITSMAFQNSVDNLDRLATAANGLMNHPGLWFATGLGGQTLSSIPGSAAANFDAALDTLKSQVAFSALQAMRDASKTGGALGQVTERELAMLQNNIAALEQKQSPEQFKQSLQAVMDYAQRVKGLMQQAYSSDMEDGGQPSVAAPQAAGGAGQQVEQTRVLDGVTYQKVGGQWYRL